MSSQRTPTTEPHQSTITETQATEYTLSQPRIYSTTQGDAYLGDSLTLLKELREEITPEENGIDLVITSPPFALRRSKEYGNKSPEEYIEWLLRFTDVVYEVLSPTGSFVIDIGGGWQKGNPVRSLYHFELLTELAGRNSQFHLAQDCYWYNPAKLPTPAQWVTIERNRVTDAVNHVWWLSKSPRPKADNTRVLREYSDAMETLINNGFEGGERPSGHHLSDEFDDPSEGGSIPHNLLEFANTASNTHYLRACRELSVDPHPARFPRQLPAFFIRFLTEPGDMVLDIFAGSNTTGDVAQRLHRNWIAFEREEEYLSTSQLRFLTMADVRSKSEIDLTAD